MDTYYFWNQSSFHPPHNRRQVHLQDQYQQTQNLGGGARIWGRARLGAGGWGEQALKRGPTKLPTGKATLRFAPSWVTGRRNRASKDSLQGLSIQQESLKNVCNVAHKPCTHNFVFLHLHLTSPLVSDPKARPSFQPSSFDAAFSLTCNLEPLGASVSTPMK